MHKVLFNRLGGLSLPRRSVVRLTDRPNMTLDVYRGRKTTIQQQYRGWFKSVYIQGMGYKIHLFEVFTFVFVIKKKSHKTLMKILNVLQLSIS